MIKYSPEHSKILLIREEFASAILQILTLYSSKFKSLSKKA